MLMYVAITEKIQDGTLTLIEVCGGGGGGHCTKPISYMWSPPDQHHVTCEVLCHLLIMYLIIAHTLHGGNVITKVSPTFLPQASR